MLIFSAFQRTNDLQKLQDEVFDIVVIGGGITGTGIALDAAVRGFKVALVEKEDFAAGTSSRSTKLIHGGLRYLKQLELGLVSEVGKERAVVHSLATHLVQPEKMLLPIVENGSLGKTMTSVGLKVYDMLAGVARKEQRTMLSKSQTLALEPLLDNHKVLGGGLYIEYRTDDARLTIEVAKTAVQYGALAINYVKVNQFLYDDYKISGVKCQDVLTNQAFVIRSKYVVNATGPWVDTLRYKNQSIKNKRLHLTKGVHIVVDYQKLPLQQAIYFDTPDGRMIFAIPRGKTTYIGTTDTTYTGDIQEVTTKRNDAQYLLTAVNKMFPTTYLSLADIESSWAGLRPLIHEKGKSPSELSRKDEIFMAQNGLISIAGGKLTGYRKMAERVVDIISKKAYQTYGKPIKICRTDEIILSGNRFGSFANVKEYEVSIYDQIKKLGFAKETATYLVSNYGKQTAIILDKMQEMLNTEHSATISLARAELWFTIQYEMVVKPLDFFARRTGKLNFEIQSVQQLTNVILTDFQTYFNWTLQTYFREKQVVLTAIEKAKLF